MSWGRLHSTLCRYLLLFSLRLNKVWSQTGLFFYFKYKYNIKIYLLDIYETHNHIVAACVFSHSYLWVLSWSLTNSLLDQFCSCPWKFPWSLPDIAGHVSPISHLLVRVLSHPALAGPMGFVGDPSGSTWTVATTWILCTPCDSNVALFSKESV